jgi:small multidrug resistance family-3 protein
MVWFLLAAAGELVGCYALWAWLRDQRSPLLAVLAAASLLFFAWCLTKTPVQVAGRAFAAYGGVYLVAALLWMVGIDRVRPDRWDLLGGALALLGALVIVYGPRSS